MRKFWLTAVALLAIGSVCVAAGPQVIRDSITKSAQFGLNNPSLVYDGVAGNEALSAAIGSFINACGWFEVRKPGGAEPDYVLKGTASGSRYSLVVLQGGATLFQGSFDFKPGMERESAKLAVDAVLRQIFKMHKLKGICNTKIVFCAEVTKGVRNLYLCDIDGKNVTQLTNYRSLCVEPGWFPDGKSVAYTKYNKSTTDILETRIDSRQTRRLASYQGLNVGAAIHPRGNFLALILSLDNQVELYVKALNSPDKIRLTNSKAVEAAPCWSPDGNNICYVTDENSRVPRLAIINVKDQKPQLTSTMTVEASTPDWSDDNKIVYAAKMGGHYGLAVLDLKDANSKMTGSVVNLAGDWESPSWAPDNRHVVCVRSYNGKSALYVVDTFTKKARQLLTYNGNIYMPAWSPLQQ